MKIVVLSGSPKGEYSITYQYIKYWETIETGNVFKTFHIGQLIREIEKDENLLLDIVNEVEKSDLVLWVYPVYTFIVPYQVMRFVEIVKERGLYVAFANKHTSQIATSCHFYDHTAYNYLRQVCNDWKMHIIPGHLADMGDLIEKKGQKRFKDYITEIKLMIEQTDDKIKPNRTNKIVTIITDLKEEDTNLKKMIQIYQENNNCDVQIFNLNNIKIKSGCLGCLHCTVEGQCVIKDDFQEALIKYVKNTDAIIYASKIEYHWFRSIWKKFDDRQFCNGHRILLAGVPIGYLISGNLSSEPNIRDIIESRAEVGRVYLLGIVTDESDWETVTSNIKMMTKKMAWALEQKPERPINFQGVGGMKVLRDLVYSMRGMLQEDHRFYKKNKIYDFPQKQKKRIIQGYFIGFFMRNKKTRIKVLPKLKQFMVAPHQKVVENAKSGSFNN